VYALARALRITLLYFPISRANVLDLFRNRFNFDGSRSSICVCHFELYFFSFSEAAFALDIRVMNYNLHLRVLMPCMGIARACKLVGTGEIMITKEELEKPVV